MKNLYLIILLYLGATGCLLQTFPESARWEGIRQETLRIFSRMEIPHKYTEKDIELKMHDNLMQAAVKRCIALLDMHFGLVLSHADRNHYTQLRMQMYEATRNGKIQYMSCDENYCSAFIDFNVKQLLSTMAAGINKNNTSDADNRN